LRVLKRKILLPTLKNALACYNAGVVLATLHRSRTIGSFWFLFCPFLLCSLFIHPTDLFQPNRSGSLIFIFLRTSHQMKILHFFFNGHKKWKNAHDKIKRETEQQLWFHKKISGVGGVARSFRWVQQMIFKCIPPTHKINRIRSILYIHSPRKIVWKLGFVVWFLFRYQSYDFRIHNYNASVVHSRLERFSTKD
jgi:hypothetical protein